MGRIAALVLVVALGLAAAAPAGAFDRRPVTLRDLTPDNFGYSTTAGERVVRRSYYRTAERIYCVGVIMRGAERDSSWVLAPTRYWDKLMCAAVVSPTTAHVFVLDAKKTTRVLYRLRTIAI
jgi:hypothetical protein